MTVNEKRRVVVYIAGQLKKYKEATKLNDKEGRYVHYNKARGAIESLALALQDDIVFQRMYNMKLEIMSKNTVPIERIHWYADRLE